MTFRSLVSAVPGPAAMRVRGRPGWLCGCGQRVAVVVYVWAARDRLVRRELCAKCFERARKGGRDDLRK